MLALSQSRSLRFLALGALYLVQGVLAGFFFIGYVVFLTDHGLDNEALGSAIGLMAIPWTFKVLWALLLDRVASTRFGRRRPFIILAELGMGLTLLPLLFLNPGRDLAVIGAVLFLHSTFTSIQDVSADALAVDLLRKGEQGTANGVMGASRSVGVAIGGAGGTVFVKHFGWPALIIAITAILWAVMLLMVLLRERPRAEVVLVRAPPSLTVAELRRSFNFAAPLVGIAIAVLTPIGYPFVLTVYTRLLRADLKLSLEAIGTLQGVVEPIAGICGALAGGALADRLGARKVAAGLMACMGATLALFALTPGLWPSYTFLVIWSTAMQFVAYACGAAMLGIFMRLSNPAVGATQFAIFMALTNLTSAWTAPVSGRIADTYGVSAVFAVAAVMQVALIGLLPFCDPRVAEARFRPEPLPESRKISPEDDEESGLPLMLLHAKEGCEPRE